MTSDPDCIFCKIVAGEIPSFTLHEDAQTFAFMDINPASDGHCLVIPKSHARDLVSISEEAISATMVIAKRIGTAVHKALAPPGLNLVQCNGPAAAQSVFHFHVHVLPRREGDELKLNWGLKPGDQDTIAKLAERIRAQL